MTGQSDLETWDLFLIVWYPHSGCRWIARGLLGRHPGIAMSEYFCPWLTLTTDDVLCLDRTGQVHKARSLAHLAQEFDLVRASVDEARRRGLEVYFEGKKRLMEGEGPDCKPGGVLPAGADAALPDLPALFPVMPAVRIVHLVRHPLDCFASFRSRGELNGDPARIGASWAAFNAAVREYCGRLDGDRYRRLRYEDVVKDPKASLETLCAWIGVPFDGEMLAGLGDYHGRNEGVNPRRELDDIALGAVLAVAGGEAEVYGYGG